MVVYLADETVRIPVTAVIFLTALSEKKYG
jgi:hypothetical protein